MTASISAEDRALVADWAHVSVPADATDLRYHVERGADPAIWLRMRIATAELEGFLRDAGYIKPLQTKTRYVRTEQLADQDWWQPDTVEAFESGSLLRDEGRPRYGSNLLVARDGANTTLYLFVTGL